MKGRLVQNLTLMGLGIAIAFVLSLPFYLLPIISVSVLVTSLFEAASGFLQTTIHTLTLAMLNILPLSMRNRIRRSLSWLPLFPRQAICSASEFDSFQHQHPPPCSTMPESSSTDQMKTPQPHVLIVGAGFSGLCMAFKCLTNKIPFLVVEKSSSPGGTWYLNQYPGCACDIPSILYSFSFFPKPDWSGLYPSQPEIHEYLCSFVKHFELERFIHYNRKVVQAEWDETSNEWVVTIQEVIPDESKDAPAGMYYLPNDIDDDDDDDGNDSKHEKEKKKQATTSKQSSSSSSASSRKRRINSSRLSAHPNKSQPQHQTTHVYQLRAKFLINGTGGLHVPSIPNIAGKSKFKGAQFHTAEWSPLFDPANKRIAVVGSAASAVQLIPELAKSAQQLYVLQRTPNWVNPKTDVAVPRWVHRLFSHIPLALRIVRWLLYWRHEWIFWLVFASPQRWTAKLLKYAMSLMIRHSIETGLETHQMQPHDTSVQSVSEKSERLIAALTPSYLPGCKRILMSNNYYSTLCLHHVHLVTEPLLEIKSNSICISSAVPDKPLESSETLSHLTIPSQRKSSHSSSLTSASTSSSSALINANNHDGHNSGEIQVDAIVWATGFDVGATLFPVRGRDFVDLDEMFEQAGGAQAFLGIIMYYSLFLDIFLIDHTAIESSFPEWSCSGVCMPKFPNAFVLLGPNTALGHNSVVWMIECQADFIIDCILTLKSQQQVCLDESKPRQRIPETIEVKPESMRAYQQRLQQAFQGSVWTDGGCSSWYKNKAGNVFSLWPSYTFEYWWQTRRCNIDDFEFK